VSSASAEHDRPTIDVAVPYIKNLLEKKDDGQWDGPLLNVFKRIEEETKFDLKFKVLPFPRVVQMTQTNQTDLAIYIESPSRNMYATPVLEITKTFFVVASLRETGIKQVSDLIGKKVGIANKGATINLIHQFPHDEILKFDSHNSMLNALFAGKVDALVTPDFRFVEMVENASLSYDMFSKPFQLSSKRLMIYCSKKFEKNAEFIKKLKNIRQISLTDFGSNALFKHYTNNPRHSLAKF